MSGHFKERRERLMKSHPYCAWCGCEVIYYPLQNHETPPDNFATLDHIHSRISGKRFDPKFKAITMVLSCHKCNQERSRFENKNLVKWEQWKRSGKYPRWLAWLKKLHVIKHLL